MPTRKDPEALRQRRRSALGSRVRQLRTDLNWTQEDLAHQTGFDRKSINRLETAAYSPTVDRLFFLADALGVSLSELVAGVD